jgi:toxin FitB
MIVLDTNVVSELMRPKPEPLVVSWVDAQAPGDLWLTTIVAAEIMVGIARLDDGARKRKLAQMAHDMLDQDFAGQILPFDLEAASVYAGLVAQRERVGEPIAMADAQIAAICFAHEAVFATRNLKHFQGLGLTLVNPWRAGKTAPEVQ